jgi:hypothetical protein
MLKKLQPTTEANYRVRLRKLRKVFPLLTDPKQIEQCSQEMHRLADKLGMEMEDPRLDTGPGRPPIRLAITQDLLDQVPEPKYEKSLAGRIEDMERSERELREMEVIMKRTGMTKEEIQERNRLMNEEAQKNKTVQDKTRIFEEALDNALARAIREKGGLLTNQEKALVEVAVQDEFRQRAEEERLEEGEQKGNPTGS